MLDVFAQIRRVAPRFRTALITGPTGSGKELAARTLHDVSSVSTGPFIECNCAAVVETLFESELFGHVKGSFTGATGDKMGFFERAHGGTLLLDEVGEIPLATQAKLLRVLQDQRVQRVGSATVRKVDVRVIAATNRDLRQQIELKQFRDDLYYRLAMVEIQLPPLSRRPDDILLLADFLLDRFASQYGMPVPKLIRQASDLLLQYSWPGNVREMENVLGSACMLSERGVIDVRCLPHYLRAHGADAASDASVFQCPDLPSLADLERRYAQAVLARVRNNKAQASQVLGISRPKLYRLLYGGNSSSATAADSSRRPTRSPKVAAAGQPL
jgi:transcriptional regulator with PAS, ATPase and Fis domain